MDSPPGSRSRQESFGDIFGSVEEFVRELGGKRVIKRVLVANNGIAAVKGIRSVRKWAYETFGNENEVRVGWRLASPTH